MNAIKPYSAVLSVRTAADETASGMSQGEFADLIYHRIAGGGWRWDRAVLSASRQAGCPQWALITLMAPEHGFGFAYFFVDPSDAVQLVMGGLVPEPIELPMPETDGVSGSVMGMRCGHVRVNVTVTDSVNWLAAIAKGSGLLDPVEGWNLDMAMIRAQMDVVAPDHELIACPVIGGGEGN